MERINKLFLKKSVFLTLGKKLVRVEDILCFIVKERRTFAYTRNKEYEIFEGLNQLQQLLSSLFIRTHRDYLINLDAVEGFSRRFKELVGVQESDFPESNLLFELDIEALGSERNIIPKILFSRSNSGIYAEGTLYLKGFDDGIPITSTYSKAVKKAFGIRSFHYLLPEHLEDKKLRLLDLIDFGWRELKLLNVKNKKAVKAFRDKWDIKLFDKTNMLHYFRQVEKLEIDKRMVFRNLIFQKYKWIQAGIIPKIEGNIRSFWYEVKRTLAHDFDVWKASDIHIFYDSLQTLIEEDKLFKYRDFGFMDMGEDYRKLGADRPEIVLMVEKRGLSRFIQKVADGLGVTSISLQGEPSSLSLEYFADELKQVIGNKSLEIYSVTDLDPAGYSIQRNLVAGLKRQGLKVAKVFKIIHPAMFAEPEEVEWMGYPVVRYKIIRGKTIPLPPTNMSQITKARAWYQSLNDKRFMTSRKIEKGKLVTILGIESDGADKMEIKRIIEAEVNKG